MNFISADILTEILNHVDDFTLIRFSQVNRRLRTFYCTNKKFWIHRITKFLARSIYLALHFPKCWHTTKLQNELLSSTPTLV